MADTQPDLFGAAEPRELIAPPDLPASWAEVLAEEFTKPYFQKLQQFVAEQRQGHTIFPPEKQVYTAFFLTPYPEVKVLLLGQDPYHDEGQAHGLCFSVQPGTPPPPSLRNIFIELRNDLGCKIPYHGHLARWAQQGVMLLNAVLTVRAHEPGSHKDKGWEKFTDAVIHKLNLRAEPVVFVLWGAYARKKAAFIDQRRHTIVESAHPSPLSANTGFFGSRPFSKINAALKKYGYPEINWQLPDL
jgi:uracil-DNA glycosylase